VQRLGSQEDRLLVVRSNHLHHLVSRFFFTLVAKGPEQNEVDWVRQQLSDREFELWAQMSSADRVHSISVAKRVRLDLPGDKTASTAGLLHDVGKVAVRSGVTTRVVASIAKPMVTAERLKRWSSSGSFLSNLASFLEYPRIGAELLQAAGSDEFVVRWAAEHHLQKDKWTVDERRGEVLVRADYLAM